VRFLHQAHCIPEVLDRRFDLRVREHFLEFAQRAVVIQHMSRQSGSARRWDSFRVGDDAGVDNSRSVNPNGVYRQ